MNPKQLLLPAALFALCASAAVPTVSDVTTAQDGSRRVTVNYTLADEPGIVTMSAQTNRGDGVWVDVDDANLTFVAGDVNKVVGVGSHSFTWLPRKSWPNQYITGGNIRIGVKAWATNAPPDYMVVSLVSAKSVEYFASARAIPYGIADERYKTDYLVMRKIPAANVRWRMGSPENESGSETERERETPREVTLSQDFYIGVYQVTQRQYERIMNARPSYFKLDSDYATRPVEKVSYEGIRGEASSGYNWPTNGHAVDSARFLGKLRTLTDLDGFDLPLEAQWEYACRAGCGAALYSGKELDNTTTSTNLGVLARYSQNGVLPASEKIDPLCTADSGTAKVGSYEPNDWGLYDMLGNVAEWCLDWWQASPIGYDIEIGPASNSGGKRVFRGGGWIQAPRECRCARRGASMATSRYMNYGFRVAYTAGLH